MEGACFMSHLWAVILTTQVPGSRWQHVQTLIQELRAVTPTRARCPHWVPQTRPPRHLQTQLGNGHFEIMFLCSNGVYACLCCEGGNPPRYPTRVRCGSETGPDVRGAGCAVNKAPESGPQSWRESQRAAPSSRPVGENSDALRNTS